MSAQGLDGGNDARRIAHETKRTDLVQRTLYVGFPMTVDSVYQVNVEGSLERRSRLRRLQPFLLLVHPSQPQRPQLSVRAKSKLT